MLGVVGRLGCARTISMLLSAGAGAVLLSVTLEGSADARAQIQHCRIAKPSVSFVVPDDWACLPGGVRGLRFEVRAPGRIGFIDIYTARSRASLEGLLNQAVNAHAIASAGSSPKVTSTHVTVAGRPATVYAVRFPGVFDEGASGEIRDSIYAFTRSGTAYVIEYSSIDPWATRNKPDFSAFIGSLHFG
jgi:hypothetical protein